MTVLDLRRLRLGVLLALLLALVAGSSLRPVTDRDGSSVVVIVGKLDARDARPEQVVRRVGGQVLHELSVVSGFTARVPRTVLPTLRHAPGVRFAELNRSLHLLGQYGQDSGVASAVYTDVTRASRVWGTGNTGGGVTVALVDTGVSTTGDLAGRVVHAEDFTVEKDDQDNYGHGTFVAGLIAGTGAASAGAVKGIAPGAQLVSLKIAGRDGATDVTMVLEALEWLVTHRSTYGIRVVNLSLGFDPGQSYTVDPLDFAVERVWSAGIVVVAAAGNTAGVVTSPGNDPYVITVGASNDRTTLTLGDDRIASFSGGGITPDLVAKPDIYAPGKSVVSSRSVGSFIDEANPSSAIGESYGRGSGTSFSTAIVSGVAALALARTPSLSPDQVKHRIAASGRPLGLNLLASGVDAWSAVTSWDNTPANIGVTPATGGGSLQTLRGMACVRDSDGACVSDAEADALLGFDPTRYFGDTWAGSTWVGSTWVGDQWAGSTWVDSQWAGSQWMGSTWVGSTWVAGGWSGSTWVSSPMSGSVWSMLPEGR